MNSGFGTAGSKNQRFDTGDCRIEEFKESFGVKRVVMTGTESIELIETHLMKFSEVEDAHEYDSKSLENMVTVEQILTTLKS